jgi:hypothetical protein
MPILLTLLSSEIRKRETNFEPKEESYTIPFDKEDSKKSATF